MLAGSERHNPLPRPSPCLIALPPRVGLHADWLSQARSQASVQLSHEERGPPQDLVPQLTGRRRQVRVPASHLCYMALPLEWHLNAEHLHAMLCASPLLHSNTLMSMGLYLLPYPLHVQSQVRAEVGNSVYKEC